MIDKIYFSIVIPTFNGEKKISALLNGLINQEYRCFEINIVIDGSTDNTEQVAKQILEPSGIPFLILNKSNSGRGSTRNFGVKYAKNDFLIFFDDDMVPEPDCLKLFSKFHSENKESIVVGSQMEDYKFMSTDFQRYKAFLSRKWEGYQDGTLKRFNSSNLHLTAANFSISTSLFKSLNGFDERLSDVEDFELATRAFQSGIPIFFMPNAKAWHNDLISCKSYVKRQKQYNEAYKALLKFRPELIGQFEQTRPYKISNLKKLLYLPFSLEIWKSWIDSEILFIKVLPKKIRYKIYDLVVWAQAKVFLD